MRKLLSTFIAVALAVPVFAADSEMGVKQPASGKVEEKATYGKLEEKEVRHAKKAIGELEQADPGLTKLFSDAPGYAVFPTVGKGGLGIGAAHGTGVLYENGLPLGKTTLTQLTVGAQIGGQAYTEVIFFETEDALKNFKAGRFALAAQVSAVAAAEGASANAKYVNGVSVFTLAKGGVMAEASVGGQKFSYAPFRKVVATNSR
jgi:lipid-binding SYLF domain-containing protein